MAVRTNRQSARRPSGWIWLHRARTRHVHHRLVAVGVAVVAALAAAGLISTSPPRYGQPAPVPHGAPPDRPAPPPAPIALQAELERLAAAYREPVGIAVMDIDEHWVGTVNGDESFPQQSVSKTWVALTVLDAIDRGQLAFDQPVFMGPLDRSVFYQPIARHLGPLGFTTDVADLLRRALTQSDNAANDMLLKLVGGVGAVMNTLDRKGLEGLRLGADEKHLQAMIAGVPWNDNLVLGNKFREVRETIPESVRDQAMDAYVADPYDGATPIGIVNALAALKRGQLLSTTNSEFMIDTMMANTTGHSRLRAGAPHDWEIGDKTGTGQDWRGASVGINDIALMTAPDGRSYAVAVMIQRTKQSLEARRQLMQAVSRAVVNQWRADAPPELLKAEAAPVEATPAQAAPPKAKKAAAKKAGHAKAAHKAKSSKAG